MGLFRVACLLEDQQDRTRSVRVPDVGPGAMTDEQ